ncbi:MAG: YerC/YecD family TrpR-related protein [bacterium]|nr:YerC/YecD family TrpR-related protein [bacterium]
MNWNQIDNKRLIKALLSIKNENEARRFLRDLMTQKEITEFSKRFKAAILLTKKVPYTAIVRQTGLSSTTVARVALWLGGREGGYKRIINRLHLGGSAQLGRGSS